MMSISLPADLRHAWRSIVRAPVVAVVVIISLGIGIGVNTAVFSWIQAVVMRPLPGVRDATSFLLIESSSEAGAHPGTSWLEYQDLRRRLSAFPDLVAFRMSAFTIGASDHAERSYGLLVSGNYFSALGLKPAVGRFLRPDEVSQAGAAPVVVISHDYWKIRYNESRTVIGRTLRVNERPLTIVGVTPSGFQGTVLGLNFDLWVPATLAPALLGGSRELEDRGIRGYSLLGRLAPGATRAGAQGEADAAMHQLAQLFPETNLGMRVEVLRFWQVERGPQQMLAKALLVLQAVMLLLLLAVCGNTANLILARASARHREIGVRLALGAGRRRVISLLLTESLTMAVIGAAVGVLAAIWGTQALRAVPMIGAFPIKFQTSVDVIGLSFAVTLGIGCGLLFGLIPALHLARMDPQAALRSGVHGTCRNRARGALMSTQVALALIVLTAAALFLRSFRETRSADTGFRREGVLLAAYDLSARNPSMSESRAFAGDLLSRVAALPGVEGAAIATSVPLDIHGLPVRSFTIEGRARSDAGSSQALSNIVTPGYFATMAIPLRAGRDFAALADADAPPEAIVNDAFVRHYLADVQPLGRRLESGGKLFTIVGVVRTSLYDSFGERPTPAIYFSYRDRPARTGEIHVRAAHGAEQLAADVRRVVHELDPRLVVFDVRTLDEHIEKNLFLRRIPARMFAVLGPLLLVLVAIGIYAVVAYSISRRTVEIGIRHALGASPRRIVGEIVGDTLRTIQSGVLIGWVLSLLIEIHVAGGVIALPIALGVPALLLLVAAFAAWIPARRAAIADPLAALRAD
jgi:predicted permease